MMVPKYPHIKVKLVGDSGNAFAILGTVLAALQRGGVSKEERDIFATEALNGNYDHLLQMAMKTVHVS
jgi:hypothetical protein